MTRVLTRRQMVVGAASAGAAVLIGVDALRGRLPERLLSASQTLTIRTQRLLLRRRPLVREFSAADVSELFPTNGTTRPIGEAYGRLAENGFSSWRLRVDGLVANPLTLSLAQLRALPARSQITMHSCDEGWNAIAQWKGVTLGQLLSLAAPASRASYVVFHCMDKRGDGERYYESIDLFDAFHPQTILAYEMNGRPLPVAYGAPLRLRVETQIGYKNAKYVDRIELADRLDGFGKGRGGWWEDSDNAVWYAGQ
jgi:DMSO/TMAO reductase YedYZ molybdopterin-dependent catalytic subunit